MIEDKKQLVSINELAKELKINKSKIAFYVGQGLLKPMAVVGKMSVFNKDVALASIKLIEKKKKEGLTLDEISGQLP